MYYTIFAKREENFLAKIDVAPLAGARIEIKRWMMFLRRVGSLPSRERGLKSHVSSLVANHSQSLPSRERGLKLYAVPAGL